jgi:hypothetical protein
MILSRSVHAVCTPGVCIMHNLHCGKSHISITCLSLCEVLAPCCHV